MTATPQGAVEPGAGGYGERAGDNLWMHFTRHSSYGPSHPVPVIVRGEGPYIWDERGKRYLDGLAGLFVVQVGHGRAELAQAAARQAEQLAFFPLWSYAHPAGRGARRATGLPGARRPEPRLLHHRRRRGRRERRGRWPSSTSS